MNTIQLFLCNLINVINIEKLMWLTFIIFKLKLINKYGYISIYTHINYGFLVTSTRKSDWKNS